MQDLQGKRIYLLGLALERKAIGDLLEQKGAEIIRCPAPLNYDEYAERAFDSEIVANSWPTINGGNRPHTYPDAVVILSPYIGLKDEFAFRFLQDLSDRKIPALVLQSFGGEDKATAERIKETGAAYIDAGTGKYPRIADLIADHLDPRNRVLERKA